MKTLKQITSFLLIFVMAFCLASCGTKTGESNEAQVGTVGFSLSEAAQNSTESAITLKVAGLKGPTSMGMVKLMEDCSSEETKVVDCDFTMAGSADEITPLLIKGELDIAAVPVNLASVLYKNSEQQIRLLAVNTLGVLYIVSKGETISSLNDLKGKTIYATGKGSTPEYNLRYLLSQNGIDPDNDLTIEFKSEPAEIVAIMATETSSVAMLPQPYVTVAQNTVEGLKVDLALNDEWEKLGNGSTMVTGVIVVRQEVLKNNPKAVYNFLAEYENSVNWVLDNSEEAASLCEKFGIVKAAIAKKALPQCNICYYDAEDANNMVNGYLSILYELNPKSIGGELPNAKFYVTKDGFGQ